LEQKRSGREDEERTRRKKSRGKERKRRGRGERRRRGRERRRRATYLGKSFLAEKERIRPSYSLNTALIALIEPY
jgi:hypothetical protein